MSPGYVAGHTFQLYTDRRKEWNEKQTVCTREESSDGRTSVESSCRPMPGVPWLDCLGPSAAVLMPRPSSCLEDSADYCRETASDLHHDSHHVTLLTPANNTTYRTRHKVHDVTPAQLWRPSSRWLVCWSLTSLFSINTAITETKGQGLRVILTQWRKASDILTSTLATFLFSSHAKGKGIDRLILIITLATTTGENNYRTARLN